MEKYKGNIITFPNILSFSRIMLSPIIFIVKENKTLLFSVLLLIGLTDILDGYIARKNKIQTIIGSWLDSLADFIFYILLVVYLISWGLIPRPLGRLNFHQSKIDWRDE